MAATEYEDPKLLKHLKDLDLSKEEINRFSKCFKEPEFKDMFMNYIKEISDSTNKETMENHLKQCEQNLHGHNKSPIEGKDLLLPYVDFCLKTCDLKTNRKVFINICYCNKIIDCKSCKDFRRNGTEWEIPYSLGGPSEEKDKAGKKCLVYDFIVGVKTHEYANESNSFKKFLILTAIEAIEKQKDIQLEKNYSLPLMKYKGKNGSKEPRIFTVRKAGSSKSSEDKDDSKKLIKHVSKSNEDKVKKKNVCNKENDTKKETIEQSDNSNVEKDKDCVDADKWESEITPMYEVLYRNTVDYSKHWIDPKVKDNNTLPEEIVLCITLPNILHIQDILVDLDINQVFLRVRGKYRLKVDLKYNVDKLRSRAEWKKETHKLIITLRVEASIQGIVGETPIEDIDSKT